MDCQDVQQELSAYIDRELDARQADAVAAHL